MNIKEFPVLYKYTQKGAIQQWQIFSQGNKFWTIEGQKDGKLTTSLPTYCEGKNISRANETSPEKQTWNEAKAKYQKKLDSGYNEVLTTEKKFVEPMLAKEYEEDKIDWTKPVFVQPKLDGLRAINDGKSLMSRNGKPFYAEHLHHNTNVLLDGELYNHDYKDAFGSIVSIFKKQDKSEEEVELARRKGQMWVYDFPSHKGTFSERLAALKEWFDDNYTMKDGGDRRNRLFVLVPTYPVKSHADVKTYHKRFKDEGFEGTIVRLDTPYEFKRSKNLLKYKDWQDAEFKIIGFEEAKGNKAGMIGAFILDFPEGKGSKTFKSNIKGTHEFVKDIWNNREAYLGKYATVEFQNLTPLKEKKGIIEGGLPRFGYVIKLDRQSYE